MRRIAKAQSFRRRRCLPSQSSGLLLLVVLALFLPTPRALAGNQGEAAAKESTAPSAGGSRSGAGARPGSPSGSPFGRVASYDLAGARSDSIWPVVRLGAGVRHLDKEGHPSETQHFLRAAVSARLWKLAFGAELDFIVDDQGHLVREYYDSASDYVAAVKYLELGEAGDTVHVRAGVLNDASLGHGSIVGHYYNSTVLGRPLGGLVGELDLRVLKLELFTNDLVANAVVGTRLTYQPLKDSGIPMLGGLGIGTTFAADRKAPAKLRPTARGFQTERDGTQLRADRDQLAAFGLDLELPLFENDWLLLTPYADQNFLSNNGSGFHGGLFARLRLPIHIPLYLSGRAEWRRFQPKYVPTYFDAFYETERYHYPELGSPQTKLQAVRNISERQGQYFEASVSLPGLFLLSGAYENNDGPLTSRVDLFALVTAFDRVQLRAHYQKRGFNKLRDIADVNEQTFFSAQALVNIVSYFYADLRFTRYWELDKGSGRYKAVDVFEPSASLIFQF